MHIHSEPLPKFSDEIFHLINTNKLYLFVFYFLYEYQYKVICRKSRYDNTFELKCQSEEIRIRSFMSSDLY